MNKAVFIFDMPESCKECVFCEGPAHTCLMLLMTDTNGSSVDDFVLKGQKPERCPLTRLPGKKEVPKLDVMHHESVDMGYKAGWNACIDATTGKQK